MAIGCICPSVVREVGAFFRGCQEHDPGAIYLDGIPEDSDYMSATRRENERTDRDARLEAALRSLRKPVGWYGALRPR